jgi:hypothetical protein
MLAIFPSPSRDVTNLFYSVKYQSVCPFVRIGSPTPSPARATVTYRGGGLNSDDWTESLTLCIVLVYYSSTELLFYETV